nr:MAG: hypothetical protein [Lokiarchaeota virus Ratatoskr Meg22_1012]
MTKTKIKKNKKKWKCVGERQYIVCLPQFYAEKIDSLVKSSLYPSEDALFISMVEWWLNQPSTQRKIDYAEEWQAENQIEIEGEYENFS